jgi:LytTr DNA-binding domain
MAGKRAPTADPLLAELSKKLDALTPRTVYMPVENAKYVELIASDEISFIATETALNQSLAKLLAGGDRADAGAGRLVIVTTEGKKFYSKEAIGAVETRFKGIAHLVRTHTSFIVNMRRVRGLKKLGTKGRALLLRDSETAIPVSQNNEKEVKEYLGLARWPE